MSHCGDGVGAPLLVAPGQGKSVGARLDQQQGEALGSALNGPSSGDGAGEVATLVRFALDQAPTSSM